MDKINYSKEEGKFVSKKRSNTKSDLIEITEDKLENILLKNLKFLNLKHSWINPLTIFVAFLLAKLTSTFNDFIGITKYTWDSIFTICVVLSFVWLIITLFRIKIYWDKASIESIIKIIKNTHEDEKSSI